MNDARKSTKSTSESDKPSEGFTAEERAAIKERAQEVKAAKRRGGRAGKADEQSAVLAKIAEMPEPDRVMAERLHALITASAPVLTPRLWYGMPAYAKDGKVLCFFQGAHKFKSRYATLGFDDSANLDDGDMWPTAFALTGLSASAEGLGPCPPSGWLRGWRPRGDHGRQLGAIGLPQQRSPTGANRRLH